MPFRFPLQAVLHFRQSVEHQQELLLVAANQQVTRMRQTIEQVDCQIEALRSQQAQELGKGLTAAELRFEISCQAAMRQQRHGLEGELARIEKLRHERQKLFEQARQRREILENLRESQLRQYQREATRREQRAFDDLFLLRRNLRRG